MTWFRLILALLGLVKQLAGWMERRQAFREGERAVLAAALREVAHAAGVAREIEAKVDAKSDEAVDKDLEEWYRD